jgi:hypothetical protein
VRFWQFLIGLDPKWIVDLLSALLTPTIACVTVYIARQQWRVNKMRLDFDLYDSRLKIYKAVDEFYAESMTHGAIKLPMVEKIRVGTAEARFLFPKKIQAHLDALIEQAREAAKLRNRFYPGSGEQGLPVGDARTQVSAEETRLVADIQDRLWKKSKRVFRKHLRLV